jgi:hypothetical protein
MSWKLILNEVSKQSIINLDFPEVLASIFVEKFGKNAYVFATWFKENSNYLNLKGDEWLNPRSYSMNKDFLIPIKLYNAALVSEEELEKQLDRFDLLKSDPTLSLEELAAKYKEEISKQLMKTTFFSYNIIKAILKGEITNLTPYKNLSLREANEKYEKKMVFKDKEPIMVFPDGFKWIDVGEKCYLVGGQMRNCGSTGVMSWDKDRTMVVLFDKNNQAHVVGTYSPNEKRISGIEGQASTEIKEKYIPYVIALIEKLDIGLDDSSTNTSQALKLKYTLGDNLVNLETIEKSSISTTRILTMKDGKRFYTTDSYIFFDIDYMESQGIDYKNTYPYILADTIKPPAKLAWFDMMKIYGQRRITNKLYEMIYLS